MTFGHQLGATKFVDIPPATNIYFNTYGAENSSARAQATRRPVGINVAGTNIDFIRESNSHAD